MAVRENTQGGAQAPNPNADFQQKTQEPNQNAAPGGTGSGMGDTPLLNLMSNMQQGMSPPRDIEEYLERVDTVLKSSQVNFEKVVPLRPIRGAYAYVYGEAAMIILFTDMLPMMAQSHEPYSLHIKDAIEGLREKIGKTIQVKGAVVIAPQDYNRPEKMAHHIIDTLYGSQIAMAQNMDVTAFTKGSNFIVNTDMAQVRNYMDQISPQSILPRMDVGFVLMCSPSNQNPRGMYQQGRNNMETILQNAVPVLAVGGYTEFVKSNMQAQTDKPFIPVFRITHIASRVPLTGMIHLALALASDVFLGNSRHWLSQFNTFAKNKPNVGNLIQDPQATKENVLWHAETPQQLQTFLNTYTTPPTLFLDVIEGMARLPNMHAFANKGLNGFIRNSAADFMKMPITNDNNQALIEPYFAEVTGHLGLGSTSQPDAAAYDSRHATYLDTVATRGAIPQEAADTFLSYPNPNSPAGRLRAIEQYWGPVRAMHTTYSSLVTRDYADAVARAMMSHGFGVTNTAEPTAGVSMSNAVQSWSHGPMGTMSTPATQQGPAGMWSGTSLYG